MTLSHSIAPRSIDTGELQTIVSEALGVEVPADGSFIGYGGDSFHAVVVLSRIEEEWGVEVDFLVVLESTPASLAEVVSAALAARE